LNVVICPAKGVDGRTTYRACGAAEAVVEKVSAIATPKANGHNNP
jgi:hypothetical protein